MSNRLPIYKTIYYLLIYMVRFFEFVNAEAEKFLRFFYSR